MEWVDINFLNKSEDFDKLSGLARQFIVFYNIIPILYGTLVYELNQRLCRFFQRSCKKYLHYFDNCYDVNSPDNTIVYTERKDRWLKNGIIGL